MNWTRESFRAHLRALAIPENQIADVLGQEGENEDGENPEAAPAEPDKPAAPTKRETYRRWYCDFLNGLGLDGEKIISKMKEGENATE